MQGVSWDVITMLARHLALHPLAVEDIVHVPQRIKAGAWFAGCSMFVVRGSWWVTRGAWFTGVLAYCLTASFGRRRNHVVLCAVNQKICIAPLFLACQAWHVITPPLPLVGETAHAPPQT